MDPSANNLCDVYYLIQIEKAIKSLPKEELKSLKKDVGLQEMRLILKLESGRDVCVKYPRSKISGSEHPKFREKYRTGSIWWPVV